MPNNGLWTVTGPLALQNVSLSLPGTVSTNHGDTVTIAGSGFGTNTSSLEFIGGADGVLETTALGVRPSKVGWDMGTQWALPVIQDDPVRGKVAGATVYRPVTWQMDMRFDPGAEIPPNTYVYWTWWVWSNVENPGTPARYQHKLGRLTYVNSISDADTEVTLFNWIGGNGKQVVLRRGGGSYTSYYADSVNGFPLNNQWCRMEMMVYTGTQNGTDGVLHVVTNRADGTRSVFTRTGQTMMTDLDRLRYFVIQNYFGNFTNDQGQSNGGSEYIPVRTDDVACMVGSWKRVELTDNADISSATVREFQPWSSWADTSAVVKLNRGGLPNGTYWLHVVDGLATSLGTKQVEIG